MNKTTKFKSCTQYLNVADEDCMWYVLNTKTTSNVREKVHRNTQYENIQTVKVLEEVRSTCHDKV